MHSLLQVKQLHSKALSIIAVCIMVTLLILTSTFRLQVIEGQANLSLANGNNRTSEIIRAPRGLIFDRNGKLLVSNDPSFNVYVIPSELKQQQPADFAALAAQLAQTFGADQQSIQARYERSAFTADKKIVAERVTLIYNISYEQFLANFDKVQAYPGVYIGTDTKRVYVADPDLSHILGYVSDVTADDITRIKQQQNIDLDNRARVGKDGIERADDQTLRGEDGLKLSERVPTEDDLRSWIPKTYRSGDNIYLTIDQTWQDQISGYLEKYAKEQNALGGAAIIMEADTGKVRVMTSYPSYDLNLFANGISYQDFDKLINDGHTPLLDRAIAMQIPPGSIFKEVMATALLQEKVITPSTTYKSGCFKLSADYTLCEADKVNYGTLNMYQALAHSSNPYFCQATVDMAKKLGSDEAAIRKLMEYFDKFNLGKISGVDLPGEQPGTVPSPELKLKLQGQPWYLADLCNSAIGQGLVSTTPLQMTLVTDAVVNGGNMIQPLLVDKFEDADMAVKTIAQGNPLSQLGVSQANLDAIQEGMKQAATYGSAKALATVPGNMIAKTGSSEVIVHIPKDAAVPKDCLAESNGYRNCANSWVTGAFSYQGKKYVFTVVLQYGGRGYRAVPVIGDFVTCLYKGFNGCR